MWLDLFMQHMRFEVTLNSNRSNTWQPTEFFLAFLAIVWPVASFASGSFDYDMIMIMLVWKSKRH